MNRSRLLILLAFLVATAFAPTSAKADGGTPIGVWQVTGSLTITGNNACPPAPVCAETINFSFGMAEYYDPSQMEPYSITVYSGPGIVESFSSSGPLGGFGGIGGPAMNDGGVCGPVGDCNRMPFGSSDGTEIDLHVPYATDYSPITPVIESADLFECGGTDLASYHACVQEMFPPGECCMFNFGTVEATVTPVAEPSEWMLLAAGVGLLGLMASRRRGEAR